MLFKKKLFINTVKSKNIILIFKNNFKNTNNILQALYIVNIFFNFFQIKLKLKIAHLYS